MKILVIIIICAMFYLVAVMVRDKKKRLEGGTMTFQVDADSVVDVNKQDDGIFIHIHYATFEDRPSDGELFPDIVNQPVKSDYALDEIFWNRLARIDEMDEETRRDLLLKLQEHGFIRSTDVNKNLFGQKDNISSEVEEEDFIYPSYPSNFSRPFEY